MGLLDDAIREHLELKRRHGAAEEEVARQEAEALGPPRRGEFAVPAGEEAGDGRAPGLDGPDAPGASPEPAAVLPLSVAPAADARPGFGGHLAPEPVPEPAPEPFEPAAESAFDDRAAPDARSEERAPRGPDVDDRAAPVSRLDERGVGDGPPATEEWLEQERPTAAPVPFEDAGPPPSGARRLDPGAPGPPRDEDVLEETPDFLSETPEHDRLWFEQKPPRDFDFDK